jgi:hypothetical protein
VAAVERPKRPPHPPELPGIEPAKRAAAEKLARPARHERHPLFAGDYAPPAPMRPRYYYPGAPVFDSDNEGPPPFPPPPWFGRGRPLAGYPGPGPRGPW